MVVEGNHDTGFVQRWRIALQVFNGVSVGVEDVRIGCYLLRHLGGALHEIVVISVHAGNHVTSYLVHQQIHQHRLFASIKTFHARGQHHLEIPGVVFEVTQDRSPEKYVVVTLHIGCDAASGVLRLHLVSRLEIA